MTAFNAQSNRRYWSLGTLVLLAGCSTLGTPPETPPAPSPATYVKAEWGALPSVSDNDLQAGFVAWRSSCTRLKNDAVWAKPCATAATVSDKDPAAIRQFLQRDLDVYALRAGGHQADGLITGYTSRSTPAASPARLLPPYRCTARPMIWWWCSWTASTRN